MPARILIVLLLTVTACTSGATTRARSSAPRPSPAATAPSSAPASPSAPPARAAASAGHGSVILAVADANGRLGLYAVPRGKHAAVFVRRLAGPPDSAITEMSLSAGTAPTVCAVW